MNLKGKKVLIAYYSRAGENYVSGKIVNLPVGNTEVIANMINEVIGGDTFHICTVKTYPEGYHETTEVAKIELRDNARPELTTHLENMNEYDVILLGYSNWWGTMPMAVYTFLEEYDFSGKTIIPFCTHEGSGLSNSGRDIAKHCPQAEVIGAIAFYGSSVKSARGEVESWLEGVKNI